MNEDEEIDMQAIWTSQAPPMAPVDIEGIVARARTLDRRLRWRNRVEVFAAFLVVVAPLGVAAILPLPTVQAGLVLLALGAAYVAREFLVRGRAPSADVATSTDAYLDAYAAELTHQIALLERVPRWYLGPLVPGYVVMGIGWMTLNWPPLFDGDATMTMAWFVATYFGGGLMGALTVVWINAVAARELRRQRAALDEARASE